jgi:hypothetical protein
MAVVVVHTEQTNAMAHENLVPFHFHRNLILLIRSSVWLVSCLMLSSHWIDFD